MNETVKRIVELLFQDVEMNDEVKAIHDEVMDNCQERFGDLIGRGLTEDEAIAAVVESLKGMEEVLAGYPRRAGEAQAKNAPNSAQSAVLGSGGEAAFSARELRRVKVNLLNEDVTLEPSPDAEVHVVSRLEDEDGGKVKICTELVDGELRVTRSGSGENYYSYTGRLDNEKFGEFFKGIFSGEFKWDSLGEMVGSLTRSVKVNFGNAAPVRIQVPAAARLMSIQVETTSGDVGVDNLSVNELKITSRSGDLRVELPVTDTLNSVEIRTNSGDVEAWLAADQAVLQSLSGDVRFVGRARVLTANSTSGDVTIESREGCCEACEVGSVSGDVHCSGPIKALKARSTSGDVAMRGASEEISFSTVSGDVNLEPQGGWLRSVEGHTTSGDVTIQLPGESREADINFHTVSGDISQGIASISGAPLSIAVRTVSGDLRVW